MELPQLHVDILALLARSPGGVRVTDAAAALRSDQSPIAAAASALQQSGHVLITEQAYDELSLGPEAEPFVTAPLPERVIVEVLRRQGGAGKLTTIPEHCGLSTSEVGQALRWLTQRGWATKEGDTLRLASGAPPADGRPTADELLIRALAGGRLARRDELEDIADLESAIGLLEKRKGFLRIKPRVDRTLSLTDAGRSLLAAGLTGRRRVTQLTPELLTEGGWRQVELQPYDVTLSAKKLYPGKEHPFQRTLDRVRRVFLEMGFIESASPWIESSFWDFDALFQPQDHPARDMQDTFYAGRPDRSRLPDDAGLIERIQRVHEDGGETGSTGWRYRWSRELAHKPVLRTHTTAATIRALAAHARRDADGAGKYFSIGPVFRRETVDYKHLPVFHQVDGIVVDAQASLSTLLGTLGAFYAKMGFPKIRFRPSFFPYTEPSAEVYLYFEQRREWVEMGGSGVFRPEVTQPLGIRHRVIAWGLGLERLAMMLHGLTSIGQLYFATMPWLREAPLRRD